jgi:diguanylate cyclase (GGDEF)-like protein
VLTPVADNLAMCSRQVSILLFWVGLGCAQLSPAGFGVFALAQSTQPANAQPIPRISSLLAVATAAAIFFFALWIFGRLRERRLVNYRQDLQFQLLASAEALSREKADLTDAREALRSHAVRDEMTGLPNRTSIVEVLDREMARAVRDKSTLSVVLADIDYLAKINESLGQAAGDEVLKEVARRLEHAIRNYDAAGRFGGGEFLLVLPSFEGDTGVERLRKIHESICGKPVILHDGPLNVTCSFGVSILLPNQFYSSDELLERAGQAMSTAKQDGRNRIGFFARLGG